MVEFNHFSVNGFLSRLILNYLQHLKMSIEFPHLILEKIDQIYLHLSFDTGRRAGTLCQLPVDQFT